MLRAIHRVLGFVLTVPLVLAAARKPRAMPTAQLPIEPFSSDREVLEEASPLPSVTQTAKAEAAEIKAGDELGVGLRLQMSQEGFGMQLRFLEYSQPWFAISQTLRAFDSARSDNLFEQRYGLLLGLGMYPWRGSLLSPFFTLEGGWERFSGDRSRDFPIGEAAAGLKLQFNRLTSFTLQWTSSYFLGMQEPLFEGQTYGRPSHASVEVFFNMDWQTRL